jgi:hypothetical protein
VRATVRETVLVRDTVTVQTEGQYQRATVRGESKRVSVSKRTDSADSVIDRRNSK